jgi:hypothetical protein
MKLSKREKNLLIISGVLVALFGLYYLVVTPIHENYETAKNEYELVEDQLRVVEQRLLGDDDMDSMVENYKKDIERLEKELPSVLHLEEIINIMFNTFGANDIVINSISFSMQDRKEDVAKEDGKMGIENLQKPMSVEEILDEYDDSRTANRPLDIANEILGEINYDRISYLSITMNYTANYNNLKNVLFDLENLDLTAVTNNIDISKNDTEVEGEVMDYNSVNVNMSLAIPFFYDNEEEKEFIFNYSEQKGNDYRTNGPFEYIPIKPKDESKVGSNSTSNSSSKVEEKEEEEVVVAVKPDFFITLNPEASDLAAQTISQYSYSKSELALNSNNNQRFELNIKEDGGKLRYQLINSIDAFPSQATDFAFVPQGDTILVKVLSSSRGNSNDNASMTLVLNNASSKKVVFHVYYDDDNRPRFNLVVNKGQFSVEKK